jgi:hypothetical protein
MKMPATFSEAFLQAELDYRRERLTGSVARRQPRVRKSPARRRWRRVSATVPAPVRVQPAEMVPAACRPIRAGSLH